MFSVGFLTMRKSINKVAGYDVLSSQGDVALFKAIIWKRIEGLADSMILAAFKMSFL